MVLIREEFLHNIKSFIHKRQEQGLETILDIDYYLDTKIICKADDLGRKLIELENVVGVELDDSGTYFTIKVARKEWI